LRQRLASAPPHHIEALAANDDLRGFLRAVIRHHEEGRIADGDWDGIAHFLMGRRVELAPSVRHLGLQWPRARESGSAMHGIFRSDRSGAGEGAEKTIAKFQALWAFLKEHAPGGSWLSHGLQVEFQEMCGDRAIGAPDRLEVLDLVAQQLGPMSSEQLRDCMRRSARFLDMLAQEVYPCIRDLLTRISNEASWQLDLFSTPPEPFLPAAPLDNAWPSGWSASSAFGGDSRASHRHA
jgi:hypothetical protein